LNVLIELGGRPRGRVAVKLSVGLGQLGRLRTRPSRRQLKSRGDRRPRPARATAFDLEALLHPATKSLLVTTDPMQLYCC
jgi:hypothetical protein